MHRPPPLPPNHQSRDGTTQDIPWKSRADRRTLHTHSTRCRHQDHQPAQGDTSRGSRLSKTHSGGISLPEGEGETAPKVRTKINLAIRGLVLPEPALREPQRPTNQRPEGKTFSEEQLDRIIGKRAKEAEKSAKQATEAVIAEQLGVSIEEAKKIIEASADKLLTCSTESKASLMASRSKPTIPIVTRKPTSRRSFMAERW